MIARLPTFKQFSYPELAYKFIDKKETIADYREGISYLELHGYNVLCIVSDGLKGFRQEFYQYRFQYCQFHQVMTIRTKLTLHPKLQASQELLGIAKMLCHTDKDSFIGALTAWHEKWKDFINEGAKGADGKMHYVHKNTRSAYLSLKRNIPWLLEKPLCFDPFGQTGLFTLAII